MESNENLQKGKQVSDEQKDELSSADIQQVDLAETATENELKKYEQAILELNEKIKSQDDQYLRLQADLQNSMKRSLLELEKVQKFALEKFARELLVIVDTFEMALKHSNTEKEQEIQELRAYREGMELTLKSFLDTLKKFHIEPINTDSNDFNPELHEAIQVIEGEEDNKLVDVVKAGYRLHDRVIRPAMVVVSKAKPKQE